MYKQDRRPSEQVSGTHIQNQYLWLEAVAILRNVHPQDSRPQGRSVDVYPDPKSVACDSVNPQWWPAWWPA